MAAANFSRDALEMFYGPIEENQSLIVPISPTIIGEFETVRNNFKPISMIIGPMFSGKTTELINLMSEARFMKTDCLLIKSHLDKRHECQFGMPTILAHTGDLVRSEEKKEKKPFV